jgi:hypothetical protein
MPLIVRDHRRTYTVGEGYLVPVILPAWFPAQPHVSWRETTESMPGIPPARAYHRVYRKDGEGLLVVVSCAERDDRKRWLHVSVSRRDHKIPTWEQLCQVKRVFIGDDRTALQILPPKAKWVNIHTACLHLWCSLDGDVTPDFTAGGETI